MHTPTTERPIHTGTQKLYRFPNNFGASVVQHEFSYGTEKGLWELAVIQFDGPDLDDFTISYSTEITEDVIGSLTLEEVEAILDRIQALPKPD